MINQFLNLDRFVLASDRLPTKYSCDDVLALFDAADQLHLVLGVNVTQRGHHFEILVKEYESLYHLQLNGLDDPARNLHLDLHPLQPPMVFHLTNVPLGATTDMVKALIQHSTEHRLSYINANQDSTTYRNSTIRTGRWTLTVWDDVADDTPLNLPKYSKYFPDRYVGIHQQRRRRSPREQFEDPFSAYTSTPATPPTLTRHQSRSSLVPIDVTPSLETFHSTMLSPGPLTTFLETTVHHDTASAEPDREYDNPTNPDVDIPAAREVDNTTASEDVYVPVIYSDDDSNTDSDYEYVSPLSAYISDSATDDEIESDIQPRVQTNHEAMAPYIFEIATDSDTDSGRDSDNNSDHGFTPAPAESPANVFSASLIQPRVQTIQDVIRHLDGRLTFAEPPVDDCAVT